MCYGDEELRREARKVTKLSSVVLCAIGLLVNEIASYNNKDDRN